VSPLQFCSFSRVEIRTFTDNWGLCGLSGKSDTMVLNWALCKTGEPLSAALSYLLLGVIVAGHIDWQCQRTGQLIVQHDCTSHKVNYSLSGVSIITSPTSQNSMLRWQSIFFLWRFLYVYNDFQSSSCCHWCTQWELDIESSMILKWFSWLKEWILQIRLDELMFVLWFAGAENLASTHSIHSMWSPQFCASLKGGVTPVWGSK
jgi:hypothetical protein